jgi:hypothetical protein
MSEYQFQPTDQKLVFKFHYLKEYNGPRERIEANKKSMLSDISKVIQQHSGDSEDHRKDALEHFTQI